MEKYQKYRVRESSDAKLNINESKLNKILNPDQNRVVYSFRRPRGSVYIPDTMHNVSSKQSEGPSKKSSQDGIRIQYKSVNHSHRRVSPKVPASASNKHDSYLSKLKSESTDIKINFSDLKTIMNKCRLDNEYLIPDMEIIMEARLWEKIKMKIIAIERKFDKMIKNSFTIMKKLKSEFDMKNKVLMANFSRKIENLQRANKKIKMKSYKKDEKFDNILKIFQSKYENFKTSVSNESGELSTLMKDFQNLLEMNQKEADENDQFDDPLLDADPEIDTYVANVVSMVNQRQESSQKKPPKARRRSEISNSSLENAHSIGDWKDDLDENSLNNSLQDKILFPHLYNEGGPVKKEESSLPSAEWNSFLEDDSKEEITTQEIKEFFPEYYECIERCEDEVKRVCVKQMVKLELNKEIKEMKEKNRNNSKLFSSTSSPQNINIESPMRNFANKIHKANENEIIKVFNYDGIDEKQLSITTPRAEFQNSIDKNEGFNHVGEKTISKHTFEENDFMNDNCLDSSINTIYLSKESKSNEKQNRNSDLSSLCYNSNEKRSHEQNEIHSARHNDNNKLQSERSHSQCGQDNSNK